MRSASSVSDPYIVPDDLNQVPYGGNAYPTLKTISTPRLNGGEVTAVFVIAGQSNAANTGDTSYTPTNATKCDNFNIYDGGTYRAVDPLVGCTIRTGATQGNLFTRVADKLITAGTNGYQRVILVPIAYSGTEVAKWQSGGVLNRRLIIAPQRLAAVGLSVTAFIWMQGETDNNPLGTLQAAYAASLASVIATPRALGFNAPWLIGKCTYINGAVSAGVQAAQAGIVNGTTIFAGANTDSLTGTAVNRAIDDTHFQNAGADAAASLWVTAIDAAL